MSTATALYSQNSSQNGSTLATAFPQLPTQGVGPQNLDLIHITTVGRRKLVVVNSVGTVLSGVADGLVLSAVAVSSFTLTQVTASTGVILGTFTGGASNAFAGSQVSILGFTNSGNNGTKTILTSSATQITVATAGLVDETHAGTASVFGVSTATYTGTGLGAVSVGSLFTVSGFTNAVNNVSRAKVATGGSGTTVIVPFAGQIAETHAGTASVDLPSTGGTRIGQFKTYLPAGSTVAAIFANAFSNPSQLDILQVQNPGGFIHYSLNYQGVASGS
jgi:hypothetical protein